MGQTKIVTIFNLIVRDLIYFAESYMFVQNVVGLCNWRPT